VKEILVRVVAGGVVVSLFALLGDLLKPKTFAGLIGAAPSVALATLILTVMKDGKGYASLEARSMIVGAVAFFFYALVVSQMLLRKKWPVLPVTTFSIVVWFLCSFGFYYAAMELGG